MIHNKDNIKSLVIKTLPEFIRIDHPSLVAFLEAYYEWLELEGNAYGSTRDFRDTIDIDNTFTDFIKYFKEQFLQNFPKQLAENSNTGGKVDERKLIKNIRDFYESKGTEKSYQLLFRILYDTEVEFYYPKVDILKVSDGKWIKEKSIRITNFQGNNIFSAVGKKVKQIDQSSLSVVGTGIITKIQLLKIGPFDVAELFLKEISGSFYPQLPVVFEDSDLIYELVFPVVTSISVDDDRKGIGHVLGEGVVIRSHSGKNANAIISRVGSNGEIEKVTVTNFGVNYEETPIYSKGFTGPSVQFVTTKSELASIQNGATSVTAIGNVSVGALCEYPGYYANNDGIVSSNKVIQDGRFYQNYSYVLKTEITIDKYRDDIKKLIHPAGYAFFGQVLIKRKIIEDVSNYSKQIVYDIPLIGHYLPYTIETHNNFSTTNSGNSIENYGEHNMTYGYDPYVYDEYIRDNNGNLSGKISTIDSVSEVRAFNFKDGEFGQVGDPLGTAAVIPGATVFQVYKNNELNYDPYTEQPIEINEYVLGLGKIKEFVGSGSDLIPYMVLEVLSGTFYAYNTGLGSGNTAGFIYLIQDDVSDVTIPSNSEISTGTIGTGNTFYYRYLEQLNPLAEMQISGQTFSTYSGIKLSTTTDQILLPFDYKNVYGFTAGATYSLVDIKVYDSDNIPHRFFKFNLRTYQDSGNTAYVAEYIPNISKSMDYDNGITNFGDILSNGYTAQLYRSFEPLELSSYENATPFWTIHEHPNARLDGIVTGKIRKELFVYDEESATGSVVDFRRNFVNNWKVEWRPNGITGVGPTDIEITNWLNSWDLEEKSKTVRLEYVPYYSVTSTPTTFNKIVINNFTKIPKTEITYLDD